LSTRANSKLSAVVLQRAPRSFARARWNRESSPPAPAFDPVGICPTKGPADLGLNSRANYATLRTGIQKQGVSCWQFAQIRTAGSSSVKRHSKARRRRWPRATRMTSTSLAPRAAGCRGSVTSWTEARRRLRVPPVVTSSGVQPTRSVRSFLADPPRLRACNGSRVAFASRRTVSRNALACRLPVQVDHATAHVPHDG
jgi:hypothetical protein